MSPDDRPLGGYSRLIRLAFAAAMGIFAIGGLVFIGLARWDTADRMGELRQAYRMASEADARGAAGERAGLGSRSVDRDLLALDKEAALSLIQQRLQKLVEPPAKLESFHSLEAATDEGLDSVRASIRIRDLAPEDVLDVIHRIEMTRPAIVFDDIHISVQVRPAPLGPSGPEGAASANHAEVTGIVRTFFPKSAGPADRSAP